MRFHQASRRLLALWNDHSPKPPAYIHVPAENKTITLSGLETAPDLGEGNVMIPATAITTLKPGETNEIRGTNYLIPAALFDDPTPPPIVTSTVTAGTTTTSTVIVTLVPPTPICAHIGTGNSQYSFGLGSMILLSLMLMVVGRAIIPGFAEMLEDHGMNQLRDSVAFQRAQLEKRKKEITKDMRTLEGYVKMFEAEMGTSFETTDIVGAVKEEEAEEEWLDDFEKVVKEVDT